MMVLFLLGELGVMGELGVLSGLGVLEEVIRFT